MPSSSLSSAESAYLFKIVKNVKIINNYVYLQIMTSHDVMLESVIIFRVPFVFSQLSVAIHSRHFTLVVLDLVLGTLVLLSFLLLFLLLLFAILFFRVLILILLWGPLRAVQTERGLFVVVLALFVFQKLFDFAVLNSHNFVLLLLLPCCHLRHSRS